MHSLHIFSSAGCFDGTSALHCNGHDQRAAVTSLRPAQLHTSQEVHDAPCVVACWYMGLHLALQPIKEEGVASGSNMLTMKELRTQTLVSGSHKEANIALSPA